MISFFVNKITRSKTWMEMDRGVRSVESARIYFIDKFRERKPLLDFFFDNWMDIFIPIEENIQILKDLNENGYDCYYLSNFIEEAYEFVVREFDFFSIFEGGIISAIDKVIKPELAMYKYLMDRYSLNPNECIFIDDVRGFLSPANKLGIRTIHYTPKSNLRQELKNLGVLI